MNENELLPGDESGTESENEAGHEPGYENEDNPPLETEGLDDFGNAVEPSPEPEPVAEVTAQPAYRPFVATGNSHFEKAQELGYDSELIGLIAAGVRQEMQTALVANSYAGGHFGQLQEVAPELMRVHGGEAVRTHASLSPDMQARPSAALGAALTPILMEADRTGDIRSAVRQIAALTSGQANIQRAQPAPERKAPLTPSQRVPQGQGVRPQATNPPRRENLTVSYLKALGIDDQKAREWDREIN